MQYTKPQILNVLNAKKTVQTSKENSQFTDGIPRMTAANAYQSDE